MSSGASTSTIAGEACFSWAAISRLPAKEPLTVNSLRVTTWSLGAGVVVVVVVVVCVVVGAAVVVVVVVSAGWLVACASADAAAAIENRPTATSRLRPVSVLGVVASFCMLG